ncbi:MAG: geranylgeranyl reductase family protein [Thermoleophilia bacterium]
MRRCDVLVVGAGPAGSMAAMTAAAEGASVIMLERKPQVGLPVQCAEFIPTQIATRFGLGRETLVQKVAAMNTHLPDGSVTWTPFRGIICNRDGLDRQLAGLAIEAGADLICGTRATEVDGNVVTVIESGRQQAIEAGVIVGADGPASAVRSWMGLGSNGFVHARQYLLPLSGELDTTEIFFRKAIPGGYGWVFPKDGVANVGIGVEPGLVGMTGAGTTGVDTTGIGEDPGGFVRPGEALKVFTRELLEMGIIKSAEPLARTGGLIPVGGQSKLWHKNMILAGDAAGHCHPITGAGVANAIFAGELAGEAAARAAAGRDLEMLAEYDESCRLFLGDTLDRAVERRRRLRPFWAGDAGDLSAAIRKSWIAFDEYYEK